MSSELPHVRCIECGKPIAHKWNQYQNLLSQGVSIGDALTRLGLTRYCCRFRMMNPIKLPERPVEQPYIEDPSEKISEKLETLTIATGDANQIMDPLSAMQSGSQTLTVIPSDQGVSLPEIPDIALPPIPKPGTDSDPDVTRNVIKTYKAW